jgi:hypothetical protein
MKIRLVILALALCIAGIGCEMHPEAQQPGDGAENAPEASAEFQKALQPEPANPNPPSYFPTPKSQ